MPAYSAGILLYRIQNSGLQVFLVHPGGPFWKNKDEGAWSVPKGEYTAGDNPLDAAKREFHEETGQNIDGHFTRLQPVKLKSGKTVNAWAVEGDIDPTEIKSNFFEIEWPPRSGKKQEFPEVDRGEWFNLDAARIKINPAQVKLIEELAARLS
ncbi:MAG TPA: NUDIX domain-containing protein [Mucilaginibacter sp.]